MTNRAWFIRMIPLALVRWILCFELLLLYQPSLPLICHGFSILPKNDRSFSASIRKGSMRYTSLPVMIPNVLPMSTRSAKFEYQEMKVLLDALQREKVVSSNRMDPVKANELNRYIQRVVTSSDRNTEISPDLLRNTTWKLAYTTMETLPPDSTIQFSFRTNDNYPSEAKNDNGIEYRLVFGSKTFGLNAINVHGDWTLIPGRNTVFLTYQTLSMDAFGRRNIHLCLLQNLLRGRTNQIDTVYYDGAVWIEQQEQPVGEISTSANSRIWNVYLKENKDYDSYLR